jgi:hypothetical protein
MFGSYQNFYNSCHAVPSSNRSHVQYGYCGGKFGGATKRYWLWHGPIPDCRLQRMGNTCPDNFRQVRRYSPLHTLANRFLSKPRRISHSRIYHLVSCRQAMAEVVFTDYASVVHILYRIVILVVPGYRWAMISLNAPFRHYPFLSKRFVICSGP